MQAAYAGDYLQALESEAEDIKPVVQEQKKVAEPAAASTDAGKDPYLSALEAEADELESQKTKQRKETIGVRFNNIHF